MELVCTTNVVASENESFGNMVLWKIEAWLTNIEPTKGPKAFACFNIVQQVSMSSRKGRNRQNEIAVRSDILIYVYAWGS